MAIITAMMTLPAAPESLL